MACLLVGTKLYCLSQCWNIINSNLSNKLQSNLKPKSYIFINENEFKNVVCEMGVNLLGVNVLNTNNENKEQREIIFVLHT